MNLGPLSKEVQEFLQQHEELFSSMPQPGETAPTLRISGADLLNNDPSCVYHQAISALLGPHLARTFLYQAGEWVGRHLTTSSTSEAEAVLSHLARGKATLEQGGGAVVCRISRHTDTGNSELGNASEPTCYLISGLLSGYLTGDREKSIYITETRCRFMGEEHCTFESLEIDSGLSSHREKQIAQGESVSPGELLSALIRRASESADFAEHIRAKHDELEIAHQQIAQQERQLRDANTLLLDEQRITGEIQSGLLPRGMPENAVFQAAVSYLPHGEAGGDYYDIISMSNDYYGLAMADATGHGTPAAVIMAIVRALLHSYGRDVLSPSEVLQMLDEILTQNIHTNHYATMFYGILNAKDRTLEYASAAHVPPLVYRAAENKVVELRSRSGTMLGMANLAKRPDDDQSFCFNDGDMLLLYTDGVVEVASAEGEQYGYKRLADLLKQCATLDIEQCIERIVKDIYTFTVSPTLKDDATLLLLKF
jgi:serine phosphatase RsbU (regulator of sigma subunit)